MFLVCSICVVGHLPVLFLCTLSYRAGVLNCHKSPILVKVKEGLSGVSLLLFARIDKMYPSPNKDSWWSPTAITASDSTLTPLPVGGWIDHWSTLQIHTTKRGSNVPCPRGPSKHDPSAVYWPHMELPVDRNVSTTYNAEDGQDKIPANLLALQDPPVKAQPPACPSIKMLQRVWTSCLNRGNLQHWSARQKDNIIMTKKRETSKYGGGFWNGNVLQECAHRLVMWGACHLILDKKSHKRHPKHKDTSMKTGCRQIIKTAYFATRDSQLKFPIGPTAWRNLENFEEL